jgi:hypothetical protein
VSASVVKDASDGVPEWARVNILKSERVKGVPESFLSTDGHRIELHENEGSSRTCAIDGRSNSCELSRAARCSPEAVQSIGRWTSNTFIGYQRSNPGSVMAATTPAYESRDHVSETESEGDDIVFETESDKLGSKPHTMEAQHGFWVNALLGEAARRVLSKEEQGLGDSLAGNHKRKRELELIAEVEVMLQIDSSQINELLSLIHI